jgi:bifunctional DNase/RNase
MSEPEVTPQEEVPRDTSTIFRVMNVESVTFDLGNTSPQVHLMETESPFRHLSVPIALPEAHALHAALHNITGRRPSTHELTSSIIRQFQADIIAVRIIRFDGGVFYAELDIMTPTGHHIFDARTSDAFILALRQAVAAPILCAEEVFRHFFD